MTNQNNAAQAAEQEIREAFELTYAADADDPACAADLFHFTNGWRACVMSQVRAPVTDERAAFSRAEISFPMTIPGNRVYLAGPMTGHENHNFPAFHAAAERLRGSGLEVINPADHGLVNGLGWSDYMRWDLVKLAGCHSVYVLPGWEKSKGASLEVAIARALGMPVFTVDGASLASAPVASARAALAQLEAACDTLCRLRTQEQYLSMVDSGQQDALLALDDARAQARAALASAPVADLRPHLEWALRRIRTSLDTGDKYGAAQAALDAAKAAPVASAPVAGEAYQVRCGACGCESKATTPPDGAIGAWNHRTVAAPQASAEAFDFVAHLARQAEFSARTFGPGARVAGVCDHIRKELIEVETSGGDLKEWVDVIILGLDGAWRSGATPQEIIAAIVAKQAKNEARTWPDWRTVDPNKAIEHQRTSASCTCPSGDGSLRHPCPIHPGADKDGCQQRAGDGKTREAVDYPRGGALNFDDPAPARAEGIRSPFNACMYRNECRAMLDRLPKLPGGWQLALNLAIDAIENAAPMGSDWPVNWPAILHGLKDLRAALSATQAEQGERDA